MQFFGCEASCTRYIPVFPFFGNEIMCMKMSRMVHRIDRINMESLAHELKIYIYWVSNVVIVTTEVRYALTTKSLKMVSVECYCPLLAMMLKLWMIRWPLVVIGVKIDACDSKWLNVHEPPAWGSVRENPCTVGYSAGTTLKVPVPVFNKILIQEMILRYL